MATTQWEIALNQHSHKVELEHKGLTNKQTITVDGKKIYQTSSSLQVGGTVVFIIDGHECAVLVRNRLFGFNYDLALDGISIKTGKKVKYPTVKPVAMIQDGQLTITGGQ